MYDPFLRCVRFALFAVFAFSGAARAGEGCDAFAGLQPPPGDLPSDGDRERLHNCSALDLYYGLGDEAPDPRAARLCAYIEQQTGGGSQMPTDSDGVLMAIYANGDGVARNEALAKHFACEIDWQPEDQQRLLDNIDGSADSNHRVGVCDVQPFWPVNDICDAFEQSVRAKNFEREENAILSRWPAPRRDMYTALRKAARTYYWKRKPSEVFRQHHTSNISWVENNLWAEFAEVLKVMDSPQGLPARDLASADRELNAAYRKAMKAVEAACADQPDVFAPLSPASLRQGERAWLAYADAWERFRAQAYPDVPAKRLRALLTTQRTAALKQLRNEFHFDFNFWPDE